MEIDRELEEMNERRRKLNPYELARKQKEREKFFKKITGLKKSTRLAYLKRYFTGCHSLRDHGADHEKYWKIGTYNIITAEPYRLNTTYRNQLIDFTSKHGWLYLESDWPGIWNPPDTIFIFLSPPKELGGFSMNGLQTLNKMLVDQS